MTNRHRLVDHSETSSKMLRTLAVLVFVCPSIVFANHIAISDRHRRNVSYNDADHVSSPAPRHDDEVPEHTADRSLPDQWVADVFYRALTNFRIQEGVGSSACQNQTRMYVSHLKNNSYWAVKSKFTKSM